MKETIDPTDAELKLREEMADAVAIGEKMEAEYRSLYMRAKSGDREAVEELGKLLLGSNPDVYVANLFHCVGIAMPVTVSATHFNEAKQQHEPIITGKDADDVVRWAENILFGKTYAPPPGPLFDIDATIWGETTWRSQEDFRLPEVCRSPAYSGKHKVVEWLAWLGFNVIPPENDYGPVLISVSSDKLIDEADRLLKIVTAHGIRMSLDTSHSPPNDPAIRAIYIPRLAVPDNHGLIKLFISDKAVFGGGGE